MQFYDLALRFCILLLAKNVVSTPPTLALQPIRESPLEQSEITPASSFDDIDSLLSDSQDSLNQIQRQPVRDSNSESQVQPPAVPLISDFPNPYHHPRKPHIMKRIKSTLNIRQEVANQRDFQMRLNTLIQDVVAPQLQNLKIPFGSSVMKIGRSAMYWGFTGYQTLRNIYKMVVNWKLRSEYRNAPEFQPGKCRMRLRAHASGDNPVCTEFFNDCQQGSLEMDTFESFSGYMGVFSVIPELYVDAEILTVDNTWTPLYVSPVFLGPRTILDMQYAMVQVGKDILRQNTQNAADPDFAQFVRKNAGQALNQVAWTRIFAERNE